MVKDPRIKIVSDGGGAWGLADEAFHNWWRQLPGDDRETFNLLGGTEELGRFVCAYDWLSTTDGEQTKTVAHAWAIATGMDENDPKCRALAARAWDSPAVRELFDRMQSREALRAQRRVERAATALVEDTIQKAMASESLDGRSKAINAAMRFIESVGKDREAARELRAKLENEALKKIITQKSTAEEDDNKPLTEDDAAAFMRTLIARFGRETIVALMPGKE